MRLSEFKGEDALDVLADIIEPVSEIVGDEEIKKAISGEGNKTKIASIVKLALKKHKHAVLEVLARCENKSYEEYVETVSVFTLPLKALEIFNDKELVSFFQSQLGMNPDGSFGSATENTTAEA